jgi:hypothetical protein
MFMPQQIKLMMCRTASARNWNMYSIRVPKYDMKMLLGDFSAKIDKEDVITPTNGNENLLKINNDNGVRVVNFATSKNLAVKVQCSHFMIFINLLGCPYSDS